MGSKGNYINPCGPSNRQYGVALISILLILTLLATLAIYTAEDQDIAIRRVQNQGTAESGFQVNVSGEQWVIKVLENDMVNDQVNIDSDLPALDHYGENWANLGPPVEVGESGVTLLMTIDDLQGLLNINNLRQGKSSPQPSRNTEGNEAEEAAVNGEQEVNGDNVENNDPAIEGENAEGEQISEEQNNAESNQPAQDAEQNEQQPVLWFQVFQNLFAAQGVNPELIDGLIDWLDDDEATIGTTGAEDLYYSGLDQPYRAANQQVSSTAELNLIKGFTIDVLPLIKPWLTALPITDNSWSKVNVNTAPAEILAAFARSQPLDLTLLEPLIEVRAVQPFNSVDEFREQFELLDPGGLVNGYQNMLSVRSEFYAGRSCAQSGRVKFSTHSLMRKIIAEKNAKVLQRERLFGCPDFPVPESDSDSSSDFGADDEGSNADSDTAEIN